MGTAIVPKFRLLGGHAINLSTTGTQSNSQHLFLPSSVANPSNFITLLFHIHTYNDGPNTPFENILKDWIIIKLLFCAIYTSPFPLGLPKWTVLYL